MWSTAALVAALASSVYGAAVPAPDASGRYTISAPGIEAKFIPYGASLTNLFVRDKAGGYIDVVLGYDNVTYYPVDPGHPVYNAIPGRYVNRIGKATYSINGTKYVTQDNDGGNTLHSGTNNWSFRFWNVTAYTKDSITFSILDKSNSSLGLLGDVYASVTYSVKNSVWSIKMEATSPDQLTPVSLNQHTYFNLDAYRNPATDLIWDHTLHLPYSKRYLEADQGAVPTGKILTAEPGSINDFASKPALKFGHSKTDPKFKGNCGADGACEGYNGYWLIENAPKDAVVLTIASDFSGVKAELRTDQPGIVIYSCSWMDGSAILKSTQGLNDKQRVVKSSCVAIEAQEYPDGINHPEWGHVDAQLLGPGEKYSWESSWTFSLL